MTGQELKKLCEPVMLRGPTRVVVNAEGEAVAPNRAPRPADLVFVRDDGWSLGAPKDLIGVAEQMWADSWVAVIIRGEPLPVTYKAWRQLNGPRPAIVM